MTTPYLALRQFWLLTITIALLLVALQPAPEAGAQTPGALAWRACGLLECATLEVPLDYAKPSGRQIDLALIRQRARDSSQRIGSLVINPGGPGGSGVDFTRSVASFFPRDVQNHFDIVGFDPRGVGQSTPLLCHDDIQEITALDPSPDDPFELQALVDSARELVDLCKARGGDMLPFYGTLNTVQDLDLIRAALGDTKLTYLGFSYGTVIGQLYGELFPQKVRALVLDGAVDLSLNLEDASVQQTRGFELEFERFLDNCRGVHCLPAEARDPDAAVTELLRRAEEAPIPALSADRPAGPGETVLALFSALYADEQWPSLARAISNGLRGDGSGLVHLADQYLGRRSDGSYPNQFEMFLAVNCLDTAVPRDLDEYTRLIDRIEARTARFADINFSSLLPCVDWPAPAQPLTAPTGRGAPPIVVIGTTGDPATPYAWAEALAQQLQSATLLTYYGDGHTAYLGDACINEAVNAYLIELVVPDAGTTCGDPAKSLPLDVSGVRPGDAPAADGSLPGASATDSGEPGIIGLKYLLIASGIVAAVGVFAAWRSARS